MPKYSFNIGETYLFVSLCIHQTLKTNSVEYQYDSSFISTSRKSNARKSICELHKNVMAEKWVILQNNSSRRIGLSYQDETFRICLKVCPENNYSISLSLATI